MKASIDQHDTQLPLRRDVVSLGQQVSRLQERLRAVETQRAQHQKDIAEAVAARDTAEAALERALSDLNSARFELKLLRGEFTAAPSEPARRMLPHELLSRGGEWLAAARHWVQWNKRNGSDVTWGSNDELCPPMTIREVEDLAAHVAACLWPVGAPPAVHEAAKKLTRWHYGSAEATGIGGVSKIACVLVPDADWRALGKAVEGAPRQDAEEPARPRVEAVPGAIIPAVATFGVDWCGYRHPEGWICNARKGHPEPMHAAYSGGSEPAFVWPVEAPVHVTVTADLTPVRAAFAAIRDRAAEALSRAVATAMGAVTGSEPNPALRADVHRLHAARYGTVGEPVRVVNPPVALPPGPRAVPDGCCASCLGKTHRQGCPAGAPIVPDAPRPKVAAAVETTTAQEATR